MGRTKQNQQDKQLSTLKKLKAEFKQMQNDSIYGGFYKKNYLVISQMVTSLEYNINLNKKNAKVSDTNETARDKS